MIQETHAMMRDVRQTALVFIVGVGIGKVIWSAP